MNLSIKGFTEDYTSLFEKLAEAAIHEKNEQYQECMKLLAESNILIVKKYRAAFFKVNSEGVKDNVNSDRS